jgi:hypothetical protein
MSRSEPSWKPTRQSVSQGLKRWRWLMAKLLVIRPLNMTVFLSALLSTARAELAVHKRAAATKYVDFMVGEYKR